MKHLSSIVLTAAVLAAGTVACFKDPTSSLRNGPSRIVLDRSTLFLDVLGDSQAVQAELKDEQGNTYDVADATWTSSNPAIAVVNANTTQYIPYKALSRAFIHTTGAGMAWVYFETHGLKDSIQVYGLPTAFDGAVTSVANPTSRDTITISATSALTFTASGANASVVTVGGDPVFVVSQTANQIQFLSPPENAKPITTTNIVLNGVVQIASLDATTALTVANPAQPNLTLYTDYYGTLTGTDNDQYVSFTTTTADSVQIEISWANADVDIDGYALDATGNNVITAGTYDMATSANPETASVRLAAGTTYQIEVQLYDGGSLGWANYRIRTIKLQ